MLLAGYPAALGRRPRADLLRAVAEHLLERGFKYFAYAGDDRFNWSNWRCEHFQNSIRAASVQTAPISGRV